VPWAAIPITSSPAGEQVVVGGLVGQHQQAEVLEAAAGDHADAEGGIGGDPPGGEVGPGRAGLTAEQQPRKAAGWAAVEGGGRRSWRLVRQVAAVLGVAVRAADGGGGVAQVGAGGVVAAVGGEQADAALVVGAVAGGAAAAQAGAGSEREVAVGMAADRYW
jgi:hypothetical protein